MYGKPPRHIAHLGMNLPEVMYYLYLPVRMRPMNYYDIRLPPNVECCRPVIEASIRTAHEERAAIFDYVYLSARKGWATPDNPLNRPGWHCDGFGTDDLNYVWWRGPGTRFAVQDFRDISTDHVLSLRQFEEQVDPARITSPPEGGIYEIDPFVVHATPEISAPGCMRQYVKISLSNQRYNLENNSHNYLFDYDWPLSPREAMRNDPHRAQVDFAA